MVGLRCSAKKTQRQGTAVSKKYQKDEFDTSALAVPKQVSVAMEAIAADMREGLLALAVGAGPQVMGQLMAADVAACLVPAEGAAPCSTISAVPPPDHLRSLLRVVTEVIHRLV